MSNRRWPGRIIADISITSLILTLTTCAPVFPIKEETQPSDRRAAVWMQFLEELDHLHTYRYQSTATLYRDDFTSAEPRSVPLELSVTGMATEGRILSESKAGITRRQIIIDGVVYQYEIHAAGGTWKFYPVPAITYDLGQLFILRDLIQHGVLSAFERYGESGTLLFRVDVPKAVIGAQFADYIENAEREGLRSGDPFSPVRRQAFEDLYALFTTDQQILVQVSPEGKPIHTSMTMKVRIGGDAPVDWIAYSTAYSDLNARDIYVWSPDE